MVFTKAEADGLTAEQTHEAFKMLCGGVPVDTIRATILGKGSKDNPKTEIQSEQAHSLAFRIAQQRIQSETRARAAMDYYLKQR